ncbi:SUF system NifU family Fe-S cluster assembly protein [Candidatus Acetothermia bacterium]|nr:SUF system NifU family Fe-S cluster assembly protein [Candidatus Acetothermia bacterium]MBI3642924.1 SUF system NifU family Fe-S cluster assembly protein [Candidatus Acetothermia bacterium]
MSDLGMEILLDHYKDPRNFGHLDHPDIAHEEGNPSCGDQLRIEIRLNGDVIEEIRFNGKGCAVSQASASMLTEELKGKSLDFVKRMSKDQMLDLIGIEVNPMRLKCALLALKATKIGAFGIAEWHDDDEEGL